MESENWQDISKDGSQQYETVRGTFIVKPSSYNQRQWVLVTPEGVEYGDFLMRMDAKKYIHQYDK